MGNDASGNVLITLSDGGTLTLSGVSATDFDSVTSILETTSTAVRTSTSALENAPVFTSADEAGDENGTAIGTIGVPPIDDEALNFGGDD